MLRQRILSATVLIPILFVAIWFGDPWYSLIVGIAALLGVSEFYNIISRRRWHPLALLGALWTLFFILNAHSESPQTTTPMLVTSAMVLSLLLFLFLRPTAEQAFRGWTWFLAGMFYLGWLFSYWVLLGNYGREWVFFALFSTFAFDTTSYFIGRTWGKHKLAPSISPNKTWEGVAGGIVGAMAAAIILAIIFGLEISYWQLLLLGFLIAIFAQLGDLAESSIKRSAKVKDAGSIIPGHGGLLDRLDSVLFTGVVVYYYLRWILG
ncbi:phosphatidate cytidylyltransferase [Chloroflexota bacterium]